MSEDLGHQIPRTHDDTDAADGEQGKHGVAQAEGLGRLHLQELPLHGVIVRLAVDAGATIRQRAIDEPVQPGGQAARALEADVRSRKPVADVHEQQGEEEGDKVDGGHHGLGARLARAIRSFRLVRFGLQWRLTV